MSRQIASRRSRRRRPLASTSLPRGRTPEHYDGLQGGDAEDTVADPNDRIDSAIDSLVDSTNGGEDDPEVLSAAEASALSPKERLAYVHRTSPEYHKEYRLKLVHRMLMRNIPLDEIARQLDVSVRTLQRDRAEIYRRMRAQAGSMNLNEFVGDTVAFYKEMRALMLRIASSSETDMNKRLAAGSRAMQAQKDMAAVMNAAGVFDVLKFKAEDQDQDSELAQLLALTKDFLENETGKDEEAALDILEEFNDNDIVQLL